MRKECDEEELALIVDELLQRLRRGEVIDWPAQLANHPTYSEDLQRLGLTMEVLVSFLVRGRTEGLENTD
jgi:hypothetical protein